MDEDEGFGVESGELQAGQDGKLILARRLQQTRMT